MRTHNKRIISLLLITAMAALCIGSFTLSASASVDSYVIDSNHYCEFFAPKTIPVYTDRDCRTRGTEQPYKKYNAYISFGDICYIYDFYYWGGNIQVSYPTSSGRRIGYIKRLDLINGTFTGFNPGAGKSVTTYTTCKGSKYGVVEKYDVFGEYGKSNGYYQIIYEAKKNKRAFKLAWVTAKDFETLCGR